MLISQLQKSFEDEVALYSSRRECAGPDVIAEAHTRVIIPEKFQSDVEALKRYTDTSLQSGLCITVALSELLTVCPRTRRRVDAYAALVRFLKDEMNVTLTINTNKNKQ